MDQITILGGHGRGGLVEPVDRVDLNMGDVVTIVGPTGSGKTTLINDIELFADGTTPTGRTVLFDGRPAPQEYRHDPSRHPIALITQHTTFLSDMPVGEFLRTHSGIRNRRLGGNALDDEARNQAEDHLREALAFANQLTGEPIQGHLRMTELSGGQTRALLIADAAIICSTPIVLLDEVENAGIHRTRAIELLRQYRKIFIFVTHDPRIALFSDYRIVMKEGRMVDVLRTNDDERIFSARVGKLDDALSRLRDQLRSGLRLSGKELEGIA
jgi:ABC-type lipoprotein export system ATPase subunit